MGDEVVMRSVGDSTRKKAHLVLLDLVSLLTKKPNLPASSGAREGRTRVLLPSPRRRGVGGEVLGLALFIAVVLVSESVAATPKPFSPRLDPPQPPLKRGENLIKVPLFKGDLGGSLGVGGEVIPEAGSGSLSIAQQSTTNPQDATRVAAERAFQEGEQLRNQGTAESLRQAIAKYEEALPLYHGVGDSQSEAVSLNQIGLIYSDLGEKQKALEYYNQSLPLSRATGDKAGQASTLNNIGTVYSALGEKQKALEFYNQSLPLIRATGDKVEEAVILNNIGRVYDTIGEKQKALEFYNQSLPLSRATGDKAGEAVTLSNIGLVYDNLGEKQKALEFYNQSLPLSRATRAPVQ